MENKRSFISDVVIVAKARRSKVALAYWDTEEQQLFFCGTVRFGMKNGNTPCILEAITEQINWFIDNTDYGQIGVVVPDDAAIKMFMIQGALNNGGISTAKMTYRKPSFDWMQKSSRWMEVMDNLADAMQKAITHDVVISVTAEYMLDWLELEVEDDYEIKAGDTINLVSTVDENEGVRISIDAEKHVMCKLSIAHGEFTVENRRIGGLEKPVIKRELFTEYESEMNIYNVRKVRDFVDSHLPKISMVEGDISDKLVQNDETAA